MDIYTHISSIAKGIEPDAETEVNLLLAGLRPEQTEDQRVKALENLLTLADDPQKGLLIKKALLDSRLSGWIKLAIALKLENVEGILANARHSVKLATQVSDKRIQLPINLSWRLLSPARRVRLALALTRINGKHDLITLDEYNEVAKLYVNTKESGKFFIALESILSVRPSDLPVLTKGAAEFKDAHLPLIRRVLKQLTREDWTSGKSESYLECAYVLKGVYMGATAELKDWIEDADPRKRIVAASSLTHEDRSYLVSASKGLETSWVIKHISPASLEAPAILLNLATHPLENKDEIKRSLHALDVVATDSIDLLNEVHALMGESGQVVSEYAVRKIGFAANSYSGVYSTDFIAKFSDAILSDIVTKDLGMDVEDELATTAIFTYTNYVPEGNVFLSSFLMDIIAKRYLPKSVDSARLVAWMRKITVLGLAYIIDQYDFWYYNHRANPSTASDPFSDAIVEVINEALSVAVDPQARAALRCAIDIRNDNVATSIHSSMNLLELAQELQRLQEH